MEVRDTETLVEKSDRELIDQLIVQAVFRLVNAFSLEIKISHAVKDGEAKASMGVRASNPSTDPLTDKILMLVDGIVDTLVGHSIQ